MDSIFEHLLTTRNHFISLIENLSTEELNKIPNGFSNNIIWNIAHCITTQQGLNYGLAGLEQLIPKELALQYKNGTVPERDLSKDEIDNFKMLLLSTIEQTSADYEAGKFSNFKAYTTSTGYVLRNIDEAINLVNIHEGIHLGYALALRKAIRA